MEGKMKHTPGPWDYGRNSLQVYAKESGEHIADVRAPHSSMELAIANAQFIVRACNCHEELVDALSNLVNRIYHNAQAFHELPQVMQNDLINQAKQAIAKAKGGLGDGGQP